MAAHFGQLCLDRRRFCSKRCKQWSEPPGWGSWDQRAPLHILVWNVAQESLICRAAGKVPRDKVWKHLLQWGLDKYQFLSLSVSSVPNKCIQEGYNWVAREFLGK